MKHRKEFTGTESRRICLFLLNAAVAAGVLTGAVIVSAGKIDLSEESWLLHQFFSPQYSGNTIMEVFKNTFMSSCLFLAAVFMLGFFSMAQPVGAALLVYRGIGIGASVAELYMKSGAGALPEVLILVVPKAIALSFIASLAVREMLRLSCSQFVFLFRDELPEEKMKRTVRLYFIKFFVLLTITAVVSVLDCVISYLFMCI